MIVEFAFEAPAAASLAELLRRHPGQSLAIALDPSRISRHEPIGAYVLTFNAGREPYATSYRLDRFNGAISVPDEDGEWVLDR